MPSRAFPTAPEATQLVAGPDSLIWRYGSDPRLYGTVLYPLLMQVADPTVGAGVCDFSDFEHRPWDRLMRSSRPPTPRSTPR